MSRLTAYLIKKNSPAFDQLMGPYTVEEMKGFVGDILVFCRKPTTEDAADVAAFKKHVTATSPEWAAIIPMPK